MADLLVSIPSRSRLNELYRVMDMLYKTCASKDNFDVQVIIDNDQRNLYAPFVADHPECIFAFVDYGGGSWLNIVNTQHNYLLNNDYYFLWFIPDDHHSLGTVNKGKWDEEILSKKGAFADDLFVIYTHAMNWGRSPDKHKSCYAESLDSHEPAPPWTKKWCEFIAPLFRPPSKYIIFREMMVAGILKILFEEYGENRNVETFITYMNRNDNESVKYAQCWYDLVARDLDDLRPVAKKMKEYIDGFRLH